MKYRSLTILLIFFGSIFSSYSTHLIGGEMTYRCLGNDLYEITLKIYRDCGPTNINGTNFDGQAAIGIYKSNGSLYKNLHVKFPGATKVPVILTNPCFLAPPNLCIEEAIYKTQVTLPGTIGGYNIVYQRCCRSPILMNIVSPQQIGSSYMVHVPDPSLASCNSSPKFVNPPPILACSSYDFNFDYSAIDPDGDSLVYELTTPFVGAGPNGVPGGVFTPVPDPPLPPPYSNVIWKTGFSKNNQIPGAPSVWIDRNTGMTNGAPNLQGVFVFSVVVKEYRNGVLISEVMRDFQLAVAPCEVNTQANIPPQTAKCQGTTLKFENKSINGKFFHWDFGVASMTTDTSTQFEPTFTFPDTGKYDITLIANPGYFCADTTSSLYEIYPEINPFFNKPLPQCFPGNSFTLEAKGNYDSDGILLWDTKGEGNPGNLSSKILNLKFDEVGHYPIKINIFDNGCLRSFEDTVSVFPIPIPDFTIPSDTGCQPYGVHFQNNSFSWSPLEYLWEFGDGNISTEKNPLHVYYDPGKFKVSLKIKASSGCIHEETFESPETIVVFPKPYANFEAYPEERSIFFPWIEVQDLSGELENVFYFGDGDSTIERYYEHIYEDTGYFYIAQVVTNQYSCKDTMIRKIRILPEFTFFAPNTFTPNEDGTNDIYYPKVRGAKTYEFRVFDRWGKTIFVTRDQDSGWNGTFPNSKNAPIGVYTYLATIYTVRNKMVYLEGHITLIR